MIPYFTNSGDIHFYLELEGLHVFSLHVTIGRDCHIPQDLLELHIKSHYQFS